MARNEEDSPLPAMYRRGRGFWPKGEKFFHSREDRPDPAEWSTPKRSMFGGLKNRGFIIMVLNGLLVTFLILWARALQDNPPASPLVIEGFACTLGVSRNSGNQLVEARLQVLRQEDALRVGELLKVEWGTIPQGSGTEAFLASGKSPDLDTLPDAPGESRVFIFTPQSDTTLNLQAELAVRLTLGPVSKIIGEHHP